MPTISRRPAQLPEALGMYVDDLRARHAHIDQVWLLGPHVGDEDKRGRVWDLLAFGDAATLDAIRASPTLRRDDVNLMIVVDGDRFEPAWGGRDGGRLTAIQWRLNDPYSATYSREGSERETAVRVR